MNLTTIVALLVVNSWFRQCKKNAAIGFVYNVLENCELIRLNADSTILNRFHRGLGVKNILTIWTRDSY